MCKLAWDAMVWRRANILSLCKCLHKVNRKVVRPVHIYKNFAILPALSLLAYKTIYFLLIEYFIYFNSCLRYFEDLPCTRNILRISSIHSEPFLKPTKYSDTHKVMLACLNKHYIIWNTNTIYSQHLYTYFLFNSITFVTNTIFIKFNAALWHATSLFGNLLNISTITFRYVNCRNLLLSFL